MASSTLLLERSTWVCTTTPTPPILCKALAPHRHLHSPHTHTQPLKPLQSFYRHIPQALGYSLRLPNKEARPSANSTSGTWQSPIAIPDQSLNQNLSLPLTYPSKTSHHGPLRSLLLRHQVRYQPHHLDLQHVPPGALLVHLRMCVLQAQGLPGVHLQGLVQDTVVREDAWGGGCGSCHWYTTRL